MDDYKNTAVPPDGRTDPIKIGGTSLRSIVDQGADAVQFLVDSQPLKISRMFGVLEGSAADLKRQSTPIGPVSSSALRVDTIFARGEIVYDEDHDAKVTIVKTNIGTTKKGRPIHEVVDHRTGDRWRQRENKLRRL